MVNVEVGKKVPIKLLIDDLNPDKFVSAKIFDDENNLLETVDLISEGDGLYTYENFAMPNLSHISVQYFIYDDISRLVLSLEYSSDLDVFVEQGRATGGGGAGSIVGKIYSKTISKKIDSKKISEKIDSNVIGGSVMAKKITATVYEDDFLKGEING